MPIYPTAQSHDRPFTVRISTDLAPPTIPADSITTLQMGGGYVGAPTNVMASDSGYGGAGIYEVNAPNITTWDRIQDFVSKNPILTVGIGIFGLMLLKPGSSGRGRGR